MIDPGEDNAVREVGDHLAAALDGRAEDYAREYMASLREPGRAGARVRPPVGLHPRLAAMVRDVCRDADVAGRMAA